MPPTNDEIPKPPQEPEIPVKKPAAPKESLIKPNSNFSIPGQISLGEVPGANKPAKPRARGLETYASDMAEAMREQEGSMIKIALAEEKKRELEEEVTSSRTGKNKLYIFGSIVVFILAVAAIGFGIAKNTNKKVVSTTPETLKSIIYADTVKEVDITNFSKEKIARAISTEVKESPITADTLESMYLVNSGTGEKLPYGTVSFFQAIGSSITPSLLRALDSNFMLGMYHTPAALKNSGKHLFLLLPVVSHDDALAGMLTWEKKMLDDFFLPFAIDVTGPKAALFQKPFSDALIKNMDLRVLKDDDGKIVLLYGFPTDNIIVITDDVDTLSEVINRLHARKTSQ